MAHLAAVIAGQTIVFGRASFANCTTFLGVSLSSSSCHSCGSVRFEDTSRLRFVESHVQRGNVLHALLKGWSPIAHTNLTNQVFIDSLVAFFDLIAINVG
jgi:hypothetical protein